MELESRFHPTKLTRVARTVAEGSPRTAYGMRTHGAVVSRRFRRVTKLTTKVRIGRGYLWGGVLIAAAALKTPTRNGYNAQGVNLNFPAKYLHCQSARFFLLGLIIILTLYSHGLPPRVVQQGTLNTEGGLALIISARVQ